MPQSRSIDGWDSCCRLLPFQHSPRTQGRRPAHSESGTAT